MNVSEIMVKDPITSELPTTRQDVLARLVKAKRTGMPVVDGEGKVQGIITRKDLFQNPGEEQIAVIMEWNVPTISPTSPVEKAANIMWSQNVRRLPVVKKGVLVGLVTPSDMLSVIEKKKMKTPVEEFLRDQPVCIYHNTPIRVAATMMNLSKVYAMAVLDEEGKLCGILTDRDLFNVERLEEKISLTTLGISPDEDAWTWEGLRNVMNLYYQEAKIELPTDPVKDLMSKKPITIYKRAPVYEAAKLLRLKDFDQLPVMGTDDRLFGLINDIDLMSAIM
ncbi:MAG: CBS domain-containing protein [Thermoplasmata archaeon]|nr:CBS domain-containing protein [Thermoplasmata archaeon]